MTVKVKFVMALVIVGLLTVGIFAKENYNEKKFANRRLLQSGWRMYLTRRRHSFAVAKAERTSGG